jgi:hypothetical protein
LFTVDCFFENYIFHGKGYALILTKIEYGCILGDFFTQTHLVTLAKAKRNVNGPL